jgi:hypothetical protein
VIVHGDTAGIEGLRRSIVDWFTDMGLVQAGHAAALDRYIDYYGKYATSHDALDADLAFQAEVANAAQALANEVTLLREGRREPDEHLNDPRPK